LLNDFDGKNFAEMNMNVKNLRLNFNNLRWVFFTIAIEDLTYLSKLANVFFKSWFWKKVF
jgi:hypothetical protein